MRGGSGREGYRWRGDGLGPANLPGSVARHDGRQRIGEVGRVPQDGGALLQGLEHQVELPDISLQARWHGCTAWRWFLCGERGMPSHQR